jgi:peptidoglycan/LPS O-acetylase OafA/YrhL
MPRKDRFVTLDGMRGLAALVVAGAHVSELLRIGVPRHAHLAVDFFFVLSGFVIAHAYEQRLGTTMRPLDFVRIRLIRLHPLILLGSAITLATMVAGAFGGGGPRLSDVLWAVAAGIMMVPTGQLWSPAAFPLDGPTWSLFAEYGVNILFAVLVPVLTFTRLRMMLLSGVAMLVLLALGPAGLESYWRSDQVGLSLLRVIYPFFAGVLINRLYRSGRVRFPAVSPLVSMALLLAILLAPSTRFDTLFQFVMIVGAFPLLVWASARDTLDATQGQWMLFAGRLSYPLYIIHFPLAALLVPLLAARLSAGAALASIMLAVLGASYFGLRYYDEPVRAWLSERLRVRQRRALKLRESLPS